MESGLLVAGAVAALGFLLTFAVDGATRTGYRPTYHPVSALSLGSRGWVQRTSFVVTGTVLIGAAVALADVFDSGRGALLAPLGLGAFAVALIVSGVFSMDPMRGYPPGAPDGDPPEFTAEHKVHDAAGPVVFTLLPLLCFLVAWRFLSESSSTAWAIYSILTGLALAGLLVVFSRSWLADGPRSGLWQRSFIIVGWVWLAATLLYLL